MTIKDELQTKFEKLEIIDQKQVQTAKLLHFDLFTTYTKEKIAVINDFGSDYQNKVSELQDNYMQHINKLK